MCLCVAVSASVTVAAGFCVFFFVCGFVKFFPSSCNDFRQGMSVFPFMRCTQTTKQKIPQKNGSLTQTPKGITVRTLHNRFAGSQIVPLQTGKRNFIMLGKIVQCKRPKSTEIRKKICLKRKKERKCNKFAHVLICTCMCMFSPKCRALHYSSFFFFGFCFAYSCTYVSATSLPHSLESTSCHSFS